MEDQKQSFTLYCRGKCTGDIITQFRTPEGLDGALNIVNDPDRYIEIINKRNVVQVKRPLLIVVN